MKKIKFPVSYLIIIGSIGSFWIADIINPGFNPVGVMMLLLIPVLITEYLYPQQQEELDRQFLQINNNQVADSQNEDQDVEGELLKNEAVVAAEQVTE